MVGTAEQISHHGPPKTVAFPQSHVRCGAHKLLCWRNCLWENAEVLEGHVEKPAQPHCAPTAVHISWSMTLCENQQTRIEYTSKCGLCSVRSQVDVFGAKPNNFVCFPLQMCRQNNWYNCYIEQLLTKYHAFEAVLLLMNSMKHFQTALHVSFVHHFFGVNVVADHNTVLPVGEVQHCLERLRLQSSSLICAFERCHKTMAHVPHPVNRLLEESYCG